MENKKAHSSRPSGSRAFPFVKQPQKDHERSEQSSELSTTRLFFVKYSQNGSSASRRIILHPLSSFLMGSLSFIPSELLINWDFARNNEFTFEVRYILLVVSKTIPSWKTNF